MEEKGRPSDDAVLVRRAGVGDRDAFALIVGRHGSAMLRYGLAMNGGDVHEAEDAVQSALVKAWQNLPSFRGDASLRTWLLRLMINEVKGQLRKRGPVLLDDDILIAYADLHRPESGDEHAFQNLWQALQVVLLQLPDRQRATWVLREVDGLSYDEIADALHLSPGVVRGLLARARATVTARMEAWR